MVSVSSPVTVTLLGWLVEFANLDLLCMDLGSTRLQSPSSPACNQFIYTENLIGCEALIPHRERVIVPKSHALVRQAPVDDHSASLLHTMIETASDDDGWAELAHGGVLLTKETP